MRTVVDRPFSWVTASAWGAAGLTALGLAVDLAHWPPGTERLGRGFLVAALGAWGLMLACQVRLRSVTARNNVAYTALFERHPQPILLADNATFDIVAVNDAANEKYGYSNDEFAALSIFDLHHPQDRDEVRAAWANAVETSSTVRRVTTHVAKDGTAFAVEVVLSPVLTLDQRSVRMTVVTDVTERDDALADTRQSGARYRQIVETAREGVLTVDTDMVVSAVNQRAADMLGYRTDELVGHRMSEFYGVDGPATTRFDAVAREQGRLRGERETTLRRKDGTIVCVLLNESPLMDKHGRYAGQLGVLTDLTERKWFEAKLAFQAVHDPLTGLPNRLLLVDRLQLALERAEQGSSAVAVLLVDIDGFAGVNTSLGHEGGDRVLVEIARRLAGSVRAKDTVARFGGDEFVIVSEGTGCFAGRLVDRVRLALSVPCTVGGVGLDITAGIGVAVGQEGDLPGTLLHGATVALVNAKAKGRDGTEFLTEALRATSKRHLATVSDLRQAVERQEFSLRFQPVVALADERIIGAEALVRWEHPVRGTLDPQEFIAVAEETGIIDSIGQWVIEETCRRLAAWQRLVPELSMSLNISARQLTTGKLDGIVGDAIVASGVDPSGLALEITESFLMDDAELAVRTLTALRETGVGISIDDFGTGYSSLSRLNRFPLDILKIDQSFVAGLPDDAYDGALVAAVIAIAGALNLSVVAEGVENGAQAKTLLNLGCECAQGYHFHRPLTAEDFEAALVPTGCAPAVGTRESARTAAFYDH